MRIRFPIRYKFLAVTTLLLVFSVVAYLFLASHIFRRDKIELVYELNRSAVTGVASEVTTMFQGVSDKMHLAAVLSQTPSSEALLKDVLDTGSEIVFLGSSTNFKDLDQTLFTDKKFAETYSLNDEFYKKSLPALRPIPFADIQLNGEAIWNATIPNGPPLIGFAKSISTSSAAPTSAMVALVRADRLASWFGKNSINEVYAVNRAGQILIHADENKMAGAENIQANPLFKAAVANGLRTGVLTFQSGDDQYLGAHSSGYNGNIILLSEIKGSYAFSAVDSLIQRSLVFAMLAITLAFLAAIFFSRSLTRPIQALVEAMNRASKGELTTSISVGTKDEIALLATSFNSMLADLSRSRTELEDINRELEQKVKDRTRRLEETNLAVKKAQESLLQSTRMATVGEVAGRAAHEVLNPLTSIVTRLEKVRSRIQLGAVQEVNLVRDIVKSWDEDVHTGGLEKLIETWKGPSAVSDGQSLLQEDITNIRSVETSVSTELQSLLVDMDFLLKESHRINKIVQNMRELTLIKGDNQNLSARTLLQEANKIMFDLAEHHHVEIKEQFNAVEDVISVDRDEFLQVITNLIRNSIHAVNAVRKTNPSHKGLISISTLQGSSLNGDLTIEISDNGDGIPEQYRDKLFETQFTTKPKDEGTGLGLSISRRFVRAFGGDMELMPSAPGEGCTFRIQLPTVSSSLEERSAG
jgi:signal transduction histidine kinase